MIISDIVAFITNAIMNSSPIAVGSLLLLGMAVEIGIPDFFMIDIVLIFVGYSLGFSSPQAIVLFCSVISGQLLGASAIYLLSRQFGGQFSQWMCGRWPKLENRLIGLEGRIDEHASSALLFIRLGPGLITAASVASGLAGVNYKKFALGVGLSAFIADGSRFFAGYATFKGVTVAGIHPETWQIIVVVLIGLILFWSSMYRVQRWRQRKNPDKSPVIHSSTFNQRTCSLPTEKVEVTKKGSRS